DRRIVPVSAAVIATAPLSRDEMQKILPQQHLVTDTRNLVNYFRRVPGDRLLFGGRGSLTGKEGDRYYQHLVHCLHRAYPSLRDVAIDYHWSGNVAVTLDDFPHIGAIGNRVFYAMGYGGRGVVLTSLLGKHLARYATGERPMLGPMSDARFSRIPFNGLRIPIMNSVAVYYKLRDYLAI
ncbi:MAG: FAD-binding oxidoreductase, partial [Burkholderiaceae bacterium]